MSRKKRGSTKAEKALITAKAAAKRARERAGAIQNRYSSPAALVELGGGVALGMGGGMALPKIVPSTSRQTRRLVRLGMGVAGMYFGRHYPVIMGSGAGLIGIEGILTVLELINNQEYGADKTGGLDADLVGVTPMMDIEDLEELELLIE